MSLVVPLLMVIFFSSQFSVLSYSRDISFIQPTYHISLYTIVKHIEILTKALFLFIATFYSLIYYM